MSPRILWRALCALVLVVVFPAVAIADGGSSASGELHAIWAWVVDHPVEATGILILALSIVNATLPHRSAVLDQVIDRLSLLARADSPGTLKMLGTTSAPPPNMLASGAAPAPVPADATYHLQVNADTSAAEAALRNLLALADQLHAHPAFPPLPATASPPPACAPAASVLAPVDPPSPPPPISPAPAAPSPAPASSTTVIPLRALLPFLFVAGAALVSACASPYAAAHQTTTVLSDIAATGVAAVAAQDKPHEDEIVAAARASCQAAVSPAAFEACAKTAGDAKLGAYQAQRAVAMKALAALAGAADLAEHGIRLVEAQKGQLNTAALIADLLELARAAMDALAPLDIVPPSLLALIGGK